MKQEVMTHDATTLYSQAIYVFVGRMPLIYIYVFFIPTFRKKNEPRRLLQDPFFAHKGTENNGSEISS